MKIVNMTQADLGLTAIPSSSVLDIMCHDFYDDYAHHPSEIEVVYKTLDETFPDDQKCVFFQPHLYSRTRDLMKDFAKVLGLF